MSNITAVPMFTPVKTENELASWPAEFLSPFFCTKEIAILQTPERSANGSRSCVRANYETTVLISALKVVSYVLSAGILPLLACFANCVIRSFGDKFHYEELPVELTYSERVWKRAGELEPNSLLELALSHVHLRQEPGQEFQRKAYNQALVKKVHAAVRGDGQIRRATMKETMHEAVIRELVATTNRSELQRQLESVEHYFGEEYGYTPVQCAFLKPLLEEALRRTPPEEIRPEGNHEQAVHEDDIVEPAFEGAAPVVEEDVIAPDGRGSWAS